MAKNTRLTDGAVRVEGLNEVIARLKALGNGAEVGIRLANKEAASDVAQGARGVASSLGGVAAHVAPSIKATAGVKSGSVGIGGGGYEMAGGAEFGGRGRPTTQQFQPWRGNGSNAGYFLYPTIRRDAERINETYREALDRVIRGVGLE